MQVLIAAIPKIFMSVIARILTEKFMAELIEGLIIWLLEKGAANTKTTWDDQVVESIKRQLGK